MARVQHNDELWPRERALPPPSSWGMLAREALGEFVIALGLGVGLIRLTSLPEHRLLHLRHLCVPPESLQRVLPRVRSMRRWARLWEREGDRLADLGDHLGAFGCYYVAQRNMPKTHPDKVRLMACAREHYASAPHPARLEHTTLTHSSGDITALLQVPENAPRPAPVVIMYPGLGATKEDLHHWAAPFLARGIAVCRLDYAAYGETTAALEPRNLDTGAAVMDWLQMDSRIDHTKVHVWGTCTGGLMSLAAGATGRAAGVVCVSSPLEPASYAQKFPKIVRRQLQEAAESGSYWAGIRNFRSVGGTDNAHAIKVPTFLFYAANDGFVPPSEARAIEAAVSGPVHIELYEKEGHGCLGRLDHIAALLADHILGARTAVTA